MILRAELLRSGLVLAAFAVCLNSYAVDWFDDFSDGNASAPPVDWTPSPVFPGDYDASSGDYVLTPTDDPNQPAGEGDETLIATVNSASFTDTSVRTQAIVGLGDVDPTRNADFNDNDLVDGEDFLIWQRNAFGSGIPADGDANDDFFVDELDLQIWNEQFGNSPRRRSGNVGVMARFNPATGDGYLVVMDDRTQWNLLAVEGFGTVQIPINDLPGENEPPIDPETGGPVNASQDLMIQLDVTGSGNSTLLEVWFWRPGDPMPAEPFFSRVDDFSGIGADEGVAGIIYNEDAGNSPGIFRFAEASDAHLSGTTSAAAVPEPANLALAGFALTAGGLLARRRRTP